MQKIIFPALLAFSGWLYAQESSKIGAQSPDLNFDKILNFDMRQAKLDDFKGKIVVIDFWATWCAPCIKSFPRLESLQSKYASDLQIITVTDDPEERISRFLSKRDMRLPVVIDEDRKLAKIFPHRSIPHTIVIDQMGVIKAITTSSEVTEGLIKTILNEQEVALTEKRDVINFDPSLPLSENENFSYQVTITPFKDGYPAFSNATGGGVYKGRRIFATNLSARTLYEIAHRYPPKIRTIMAVSNPEKFKWSRKNAICFDLIVPEELGDQRFDIMRNQLDTYFGLRSRIDERTLDVKVLRRTEGIQLKIKKSDGGTETESSYGGKGLFMKASPIANLASFLESQMNVVIADETDLRGKYDLEIPWYNESPEQIYEELKNIGLELTDTKREVEVLIIEDK